MIVSAAILCLALTVYHEARGEAIPGQYAVAHVLWRRAEHDEKQVCPEAFKPKQFSWANRQVQRQGQVWKVSKRMEPRDDIAWWKALRVSAMVMQGVGDFSQGANHYHALHVKPIWRLDMAHTITIGRHVFYRA